VRPQISEIGGFDGIGIVSIDIPDSVEKVGAFARRMPLMNIGPDSEVSDIG
jgi:hypothetical protein